MNYQEILQFWFEETKPSQWFTKDAAFDEKISERFTRFQQQAAQGELVHWRKTIQGRLAEIIVLDQFSRNIFRGQAQSFAYDGMALVLAQEALNHNGISNLQTIQRAFIYMPFMHSESFIIHEIAESYFSENGLENFAEFENKHRTILARFGRYPHRNEILGRTSTAEEQIFLTEPNSAF